MHIVGLGNDSHDSKHGRRRDKTEKIVESAFVSIHQKQRC